jgi:alpha-glucoside transport system substrate-binding protein
VVSALDRVGQILREPKYVNGGYGGVDSIATTAFQEGGLPILEGKCALHRQASFYANWWPKDANISPNGDIWAFYLPPVSAGAAVRPVLGAGDFAVSLSSAPQVAAVAAFLSSPQFANGRARTGGVITANTGLDPINLQTGVQRMCARMLSDRSITFRFDGSDMMPAAVGSGTFWTEMTAWIKGESSATALHKVEVSWPKS